MSATPLPPTPDHHPTVPSQADVPPAPPRYTASDSAVSRPATQSKILGIVAASLGGAALLLSIFPLLAFPLAIASVVCAIIALVRRAGEKVLPFLGIGLSVLALAIGIVLIVITVNLMQQSGRTF
ncbi:hypothetical protein SPF06_05045 [Sinomonas sp. JGH33]|uniref:DUF4190 domain-containing protein n=1 Tax=Sinomonas terricola TaxID=3110330 RepID=A0ABU5T3D9_9MICC|nr:hypothetical protein [Sinomonas sp. JGH33]MEA5454085.1 hypothetical protein [Sinomonas sp. JGH33]